MGSGLEKSSAADSLQVGTPHTPRTRQRSLRGVSWLFWGLDLERIPPDQFLQ